MSSYSKFWAPSSKITGFLKGNTGDRVTGNVLVANRWAHTGVRDLTGGPVLESLLQTKKGGNGQQRFYRGKSVCGRRQRKVGMGGYLCMGPFILALDSFYALTSNFLCPITFFLFIPSFQCFSYLWTSINSRFPGFYQVPSVLRVYIGSPGTLLPPFVS
jgi:hypothetical protein